MLTCSPRAESLKDRDAYARFYREFYLNQHRVLAQESGKRYIVQHPSPRMESARLDAIYGLPFARRPHPTYDGEVPGFSVIRNSINSHRGCVSGCAFCSLGLHQGRRIVPRSAGSIMEEVARARPPRASAGTSPISEGRRRTCTGPSAPPTGDAHGRAVFIRKSART